MYLNEYFEKVINKDDNPQLLLQMTCEDMQFEIGGLLSCDKNTIAFYDCKKCIVSLSPIFTELLNYEILGSNPYYFSHYVQKNGIILPIFRSQELLGYVYFLNSKYLIDEDIIKKLSKVVYICKNILNINKVVNSKDLFLANMSHELRTPLNAIVGYSQLLSNTTLDNTQKNYSNTITQCSLQLLQIINDILDFSKLSTGNMKVKQECVAVKEITENVFDAVSYKIRDKRINYKCTIDTLMPDYIIIDKQKIIQIIINLLSNSVKFTDSGGKVELSLSEDFDDDLEDKFIKIIVKDNGIGIPDKQKPYVFKEYSQGNQEMTKKYGGTGLGLSITKKLTQLLGGHIEFTSTEGKGSEFTLRVKYIPYEVEELKITKPAVVLQDKYVLVVDDKSTNRVILTEMLFSWGMKPISCASAFEAIRYIASNRYNFSIGLIDICMPITNGVELARQIKLEKPDLPLVALSSLDGNFSKTESLDFEEKLYKPVNKIQLYQILEKILSTYKSNRKGSMANSFRSKDYKILIVEDVIYNQTLLENMLQNLGYSNYTSVNNGKTALEEINKKIYDLVLLDLRIPEIDGIQLIKELYEKNTNIPKIIPVTASVLDEDKDFCKKYGINHMLLKPIHIKELKTLLNEILK